jgi:hypothetical protein
MANEYTFQKLADTQDKAIIKLTGKFDGSGEEDQVRVDVSNLNFALNTAGFIGASADKALYRNTVTAMIYDAHIANGFLELCWQGNTTSAAGNTTMYTLHSGQHTVLLDDMRYTTVITNPTVDVAPENTSGDIVFKTTGASNGDSYSVILYLKKDARDYDKGQTADPVAFNQGPAAGW